MADIKILPAISYISVTGSAVMQGSGSATTASIFTVTGNNGALFSVTDDLSTSIFSANTISGLPVIEAFSNYCAVLGQYSGHQLVITSGSIRGGKCTTASGNYSFVGGGQCNTASGNCSVVVGGYGNTSSGAHSGILGGTSNSVTHACSFAIGSNLTSNAACYLYANNICNVNGGTSDCRMKHSICPLTYSLDKLTQLNPVSFVFNGDCSNFRRYGFIAQQVCQIVPEIITHHPIDKIDSQGNVGGEIDGDPILQFEKDAVYASYINAFKELKDRLEKVEGILKANNLI